MLQLVADNEAAVCRECVNNSLCCADIDECEKDNGGCTDHSTCMNTPGSYECVCDTGYKAHGSKCNGSFNTLLYSTLLRVSFLLPIVELRLSTLNKPISDLIWSDSTSTHSSCGHIHAMLLPPGLTCPIQLYGWSLGQLWETWHLLRICYFQRCECD